MTSAIRLRTALCDLLGIEYPIVQSGMGSVTGPELVAEVSVGLVHDLPGAGEVVDAIVREARAVLAALPRRVKLD